MALIQDLNGDRTTIADKDHIFENCYCRVADSVEMSRENCRVRVDWWLNRATQLEGGKQPIYSSTHYAPGVADPLFLQLINESNGVVTAALYNWLKTQPEFEGAIDG